MSTDRDYVFVLDGYDEYDRQGTVRAGFLVKLQMATQRTASRILIASRDETDMKAALSRKAVHDLMGHIFLECRISNKDLQHDIKRFSESMVNQRLPKKDKSSERT